MAISLKFKELVEAQGKTREELAKAIEDKIQAGMQEVLKKTGDMNTAEFITATNLRGGLSQAQIAKVFGVSRQTAKNWADKAGLPASKGKYTLEDVLTITKDKKASDKAQQIPNLLTKKDILDNYDISKAQLNRAIKELGLDTTKFNSKAVDVITGNTESAIHYNDLAILAGYTSLKAMLDDLSTGANASSLVFDILDLYHAYPGAKAPLREALAIVKQHDLKMFQEIVKKYTEG